VTLAPALLRRLAAHAGVDPRTAAKVLRGEAVTSTCVDVVTRALAELAAREPASFGNVTLPAQPVGDLLAGFAAGGARAQAAVDALTRPRSVVSGDLRGAGGAGGESCAVNANCVELAHDAPEWFEVLYASTGQIIRFCPRHALAAEALVSYAGWRGVDVPRVLRLLEAHGPPAYDPEQQSNHRGGLVAGDACKACGGTRAEHNRSERCRGFE